MIPQWVMCKQQHHGTCMLCRISVMQASHPWVQVKVQLSHNEVTQSGIQNTKQLVFVLDAVGQNPKKKKKVALTVKNFGAHVNVNKLKSNFGSMELAWRCRPPQHCFLLVLCSLNCLMPELCFKTCAPPTLCCKILADQAGMQPRRWS